MLTAAETDYDPIKLLDIQFEKKYDTEETAWLPIIFMISH